MGCKEKLNQDWQIRWLGSFSKSKIPLGLAKLFKVKSLPPAAMQIALYEISDKDGNTRLFSYWGGGVSMDVGNPIGLSLGSGLPAGKWFSFQTDTPVRFSDFGGFTQRARISAFGFAILSQIVFNNKIKIKGRGFWETLIKGESGLNMPGFHLNTSFELSNTVGTMIMAECSKGQMTSVKGDGADKSTIEKAPDEPILSAADQGGHPCQTETTITDRDYDLPKSDIDQKVSGTTGETIGMLDPCTGTVDDGSQSGTNGKAPDEPNIGEEGGQDSAEPSSSSGTQANGGDQTQGVDFGRIADEMKGKSVKNPDEPDVNDDDDDRDEHDGKSAQTSINEGRSDHEVDFNRVADDAEGLGQKAADEPESEKPAVHPPEPDDDMDGGFCGPDSATPSP
jgi:hypothetical protein